MKIISLVMLISSFFANIEANNFLYEQSIEPVIVIVTTDELDNPPLEESVPEIVAVIEPQPEPQRVEPAIEKLVVDIFTEVTISAVAYAETRLEELPSEYGLEDNLSLIDVERTYSAMTIVLGREPTERELLYMTIWTEYWIALKTHEQSLIGQEAVARSFYQFCGVDGCTREELIKFLSGYQPWFKSPYRVDIDPFAAAEYILTFLHEEGGDAYNYMYGNGDKLYKQVDEILDLDYATEKRWTEGKWWQRPSQWYGPAGKAPKGSKFGFDNNAFAIVAIPYSGHSEKYFYFITYYQELFNFKAPPLP